MKANLLFAVFLRAAGASSQDTATDSKAIEGKWMVLAAELSGAALPVAATKTMRLDLTAEKYSFTEGTIIDQGTIKIDATKKPKTIDIVGTDGPNKGKTYLAIYELKGDTMRLCYDLTGKARPSEFATKKGALLFLVTYQRMK